MTGVASGISLFLLTFKNRTFHSFSVRNSVQGVSGFVLAIRVIVNNLQATTLMTVRYFIRRSAFPNRQSSTLNPDFNTLKYISILHRRQYHMTFS